MATHIALLKGVNVRGGRMVAMADLRAWLADLGFDNPRSLINSGNLVFGGEAGGVELEARLEREAEARLGLKTDVFVRTPAEWDALIAVNPFPAEAEDHPSKLLVMLLKTELPADTVAALRAAITGPERMQARGRALYVDFPEGQGKSTLDRDWRRTKLAPTMTGRNWNTVLKLRALATS